MAGTFPVFLTRPDSREPVLRPVWARRLTSGIERLLGGMSGGDQLWPGNGCSARRDLGDPRCGPLGQMLEHRLFGPTAPGERMGGALEDLQRRVGKGGDVSFEEIHATQRIPGPLEEQKWQPHLRKMGDSKRFRFAR